MPWLNQKFINVLSSFNSKQLNKKSEQKVYYFTTSTWKVPGIMGGRSLFAAMPKSAVGR